MRQRRQRARVKCLLVVEAIAGSVPSVDWAVHSAAEGLCLRNGGSEGALPRRSMRVEQSAQPGRAGSGWSGPSGLSDAGRTLGAVENQELLAWDLHRHSVAAVA